MNMTTGTVFIIDDDLSIRRALSMFLISQDYIVETYSGSDEFLAREPFEGTGCILLDIKMEGKSGLELQEELLNLGYQLPIIFMTGHGTVRLSVETLKKGAFNFLEKPVKFEELLSSISEAIDLSTRINEEKKELTKVQNLVNSLTPRETEILKYMIAGMLNKQIASDLNIAEHTVKLHRHSISEKLGVKSVPEIMRIAEKAGIKPVENKYS